MRQDDKPCRDHSSQAALVSLVPPLCSALLSLCDSAAASAWRTPAMLILSLAGGVSSPWGGACLVQGLHSGLPAQVCTEEWEVSGGGVGDRTVGSLGIEEACH